MKEFISGRQLVQKSGIQEFEIIPLIRAGIKPYDNLGNEISLIHLGSEISKYCKKFYDKREMIVEGVTTPPSRHLSPEERSSTLEDTRTELVKFRNSMESRGWWNFELHPVDDLAREILSILLNASYSISDLAESGVSLDAAGNSSLSGKERQGTLRQESRKFDEALKAMAYVMEFCFEKEKQHHEITKDELFNELQKKRIKLPAATLEKTRTTIRDTFPHKFMKVYGF